MRFIIYILSIFILFSCNTPKSITKEKEDVSIDTLKSKNITDTTILDTTKEDPIVLAIEREVRVVEPEKKIENGGIELIKEKPKKKIAIKVIDKTSTIINESPNLGLVAHSVPDKMQVGKTYTVRLRISKENNKIQLINGNGVSIADANIDSKITIASIRVEPVMSAKLISDSSKMIIQSTSTLIQDIEKEGFTEWEWRLTPIKGGDIFIKIMVSVIVESENKTITKDIPVYNEVVVVKSNYIFTIKGFIKEYWQWIMTTIIIPFIVWFYNRKKKRKKS
jgi:hypothetical protein